MKKRVQLVPNLITAFGLACGLFVIFKINMVEPGAGAYQVMQTSVFLLLVAALADFFDGALARAIRAESDFGVVFDTLADAISFGVAPPLLVLKALSLEQGTLYSLFVAASALIYSLCGVLRLVRFNVKANEAKGNLELEADQKKHFTGLPIPAAAAVVASSNLFFLAPQVVDAWPLSLDQRAWILGGVMMAIGYLMVCRLKFPSLKVLRFKILSFRLVFLTGVGAIVLLYGLLNFFALVFMALSWLYVLLALTLSLIRFFAGKKSKTLEEFEPEPEEHDAP